MQKREKRGIEDAARLGFYHCHKHNRCKIRRLSRAACVVWVPLVWVSFNILLLFFWWNRLCRRFFLNPFKKKKTAVDGTPAKQISFISCPYDRPSFRALPKFKYFLYSAIHKLLFAWPSCLLQKFEQTLLSAFYFASVCGQVETPPHGGAIAEIVKYSGDKAENVAATCSCEKSLNRGSCI